MRLIHLYIGVGHEISSLSFTSSFAYAYWCTPLVPSSCAYVLMAYCTNPNYSSSLGFTSCGKCPGCLKNKKKEWADRLKIEMRYHNYNYFVGLTYSPEFYPADGCLSKETAKKFKKRLEYFLGYTPRTFLVGEYGDDTERAHYHVAVFADSDCFDALRKAWRFGNVDIDHMTYGRCDYISGYVTKKMTKSGDVRLDGRTPEFFLASRKPALGYGLLYDILEKFATDESFRERVLNYAYPPFSVRIGGKWIRLPRYIRDKLRNIWKLYNEEEQQEFSDQKRFKDFLVKEKIRETVSCVPLSWKEISDILRPKWQEREKLDKKSDKLRHRRYL